MSTHYRETHLKNWGKYLQFSFFLNIPKFWGKMNSLGVQTKVFECFEADIATRKLYFPTRALKVFEIF